MKVAAVATDANNVEDHDEEQWNETVSNKSE